MAQNITLMGASYSDVPAVTLPKTGGGTAEFFDARSVTYSLSGGATVSANPSNAIAGQGFSVKLKAPAGYTLSNVSVTMGGVDITSTAFIPDESGGGGGGGTVTITDEANATGTTCVITTGSSPEPPTPVETWETLFDGTTQLVADTPYPYFWISSLSSVTITADIQGTEANCSGTDAWGQVQTSSLLNLVREGAAQKGVWGSGGEPSKAPVMRLCRGVGSPEQPF